VVRVVFAAITLALLLALGAGGALAGRPDSVLRFTDLPHGSVPGIPGDVRAASRIVGRLDGHRIAAAPTRNGNYCEAFSAGNGGTGGCRVRLPLSKLKPAQRSGYLIGAGFRAARTHGVRGLTISAVEGSTLAAPGARLYIIYADQTRERMPLIWVSSPIDAGFFFHAIPAEHRRPGHWPITLELKRGSRVIALQVVKAHILRP